MKNTLATTVLALSLAVNGCTMPSMNYPKRLSEANNYDVVVRNEAAYMHMVIGRCDTSKRYIQWIDSVGFIYTHFKEYEGQLYFLEIGQDGVKDTLLENLANRKSISKIYFAMKNKKLLPWIKGGENER